MKYEETVVEGVRVIRIQSTCLVGREDAVSIRHTIGKMINAMARAGQVPNLVINLELVTEIDDEVIVALRNGDEVARKAEGALRLVSPPSPVTGFRSYMRESTAVRSFGDPSR